MNIIDLEQPPIVCIEATVRNGGQALRSIVQNDTRPSLYNGQHDSAWRRCPVSTRHWQYIREYVISLILLP